MERACAVINGRNEKSQNDFGFLQVLFEIAAVGGLWAKKKNNLSSFAGVLNQNVRFNTFRVLRRAE